MSKSRKDGRRGGGHVDTQNREVWSRRCRNVVCWTQASNKRRKGRSFKTITHRHERRVARRDITEARSLND